MVVMIATPVTLPYLPHAGESWPDQGEVHCGVFRFLFEPMRQAARQKEPLPRHHSA